MNILYIYMAKKGIHPEYSTIKIKTFKDEAGNELVFESRMVDGNDRVVAAEVNIYKHQAWKTDVSALDQDNVMNKQLDKFYKKFNKVFSN